MFINARTFFTNVFVLPIWEEKIRCTAQRMPLLCWFLFIFPSHFNRYFLAILVFRYDPPQYVKTESGRRDRLAECVDVCPHVHRPFLVKNLRVFKFLSTTVCGKNSSTSYISWDCASQFFSEFRVKLYWRWQISCCTVSKAICRETNNNDAMGWTKEWNNCQ